MAKITKTNKNNDTKSNESVGIEKSIEILNNQFGKGSVFLLSDEKAQDALDVDFIPSGIPAIDWICGGGYPKGRMIEIFGQESSGKTSLALSGAAVANYLKAPAHINDVEHAFDPAWSRILKVNPKLLLISQPDGGEEALRITETVVKNKIADIEIIDSIASLVPKEEMEVSASQKKKGATSTIGMNQPGRQAWLMSQGLRIICNQLEKTSPCTIFINQLRSKIGIIYGPSEITSGGNAMKFYATIRLDIRRKTIIKEDGTEALGNNMIVKCKKNKVGPPFRETDEEHAVAIDYKKGFNVAESTAWLYKKFYPESITGAWWTISEKDNLKAQGWPGTVEQIVKNDKFRRTVLDAIKEKFPKFDADFYYGYIPYYDKTFF